MKKTGKALRERWLTAKHNAQNRDNINVMEEVTRGPDSLLEVKGDYVNASVKDSDTKEVILYSLRATKQIHYLKAN